MYITCSWVVVICNNCRYLWAIYIQMYHKSEFKRIKSNRKLRGLKDSWISTFSDVMIGNLGLLRECMHSHPKQQNRFLVFCVWWFSFIPGDFAGRTFASLFAANGKTKKQLKHRTFQVPERRQYTVDWSYLFHRKAHWCSVQFLLMFQCKTFHSLERIARLPA